MYKDLYVTLTEAGYDLRWWGMPAWFTIGFGCGGGTPVSGGVCAGFRPPFHCGGPSIRFDPGLGGLNLGDNVSLKDFLKLALKLEEARERILEESQKPQTIEEIQALEAKLVGVLEDLRARKAELEKNR